VVVVGGDGHHVGGAGGHRRLTVSVVSPGEDCAIGSQRQAVHTARRQTDGANPNEASPQTDEA